MGKACFHPIPEIGSEFLATGILPTLSLECDYIFRFPELAEKQVLCKVLLLFALFMLSEDYTDLLDVTRLARHLWGSPNSQFGPGGLDRLANKTDSDEDLLVSPFNRGFKLCGNFT